VGTIFPASLKIYITIRSSAKLYIQFELTVTFNFEVMRRPLAHTDKYGNVDLVTLTFDLLTV